MDADPGRSQLVSAATLARQARFLGAWIFLLLGMASVTFWVIGGFDLTEGVRPWLRAAYGWWIALGFALLQVGIGRRICRMAVGEVSFRDGVVERLASFTVGFWFSSLALMILAAAGFLNGPGVIFYLVGALVVGIKFKDLSGFRLKRWFVPETGDRGGVALLLLIVIALAALPYLLQTLIPNSDWDGASTHLPLAQWFHAQGLQSIPLDYSNLIIPGIIHLVYALFLGLGAESAIIPLNFIVSLLTCLAAGTLARHFWGATAGWWAFGVALSSNLILELGLDPRIDGFLAFFCTMAAFGIMVWTLEERATGPGLLVGTAFGCALGTKYTAIFPLVLWSLPMAWVGLRDLTSSKRADWRAILVLITCLVVPATYWYLSNTLLLGDPLYPRLYGELTTLSDGQQVPVEEAVETLLAGVKKNEAYQTLFEETQARQASYQPPRNLFDLRSVFLEPQRHSRKLGHTLSPLFLLFILLPVFRRDRPSWMLIWMGLSGFMAIGSQAYLVRYGLVFYPVLAVGAGVVLGSVQHRLWRLGWAAVLLMLVAMNLSFEWRQVGHQRVVGWLSGEEGRVDWLQQVGYNGSTEMPQMIKEIQAGQQSGALSTEGKILMLGEAKFHLLGFQALPDISRAGLPWLAYLARSEGDLDAVHEELWSDGVRFLLVNLGYLGWVRGNVTIEAEEYAYSLVTLREFVETKGEVVVSTSGIILLRLNPIDKD